MDVALFLVRALHFLAAFQLFGLAVFVRWVAPVALRARLQTGMRPVAVTSAWILIGTAFAWLSLASGGMADGWASAFDTATIWRVLPGTGFGHVWAVHLGLAAIAVLAVHWRGAPDSTVLAVIAGLALGSLGLVGHLAAPEEWSGALSRASQTIHLLAAGFWLGSLLPLAECLGRRDDFAADAGEAVRRFSGLGHLAVAAVLATGIANAWFVLGSVAIRLSSFYQLLLLLKIAVVAAMVLLAIFNRYVLVPRIPQSAGAVARLKVSAVAEVGLGIGATALVAALGMIAPL